MGLASRKTKDMTVGEGFAAAADFGADVVSGIAAPILSGGQTIVDAVSGVPAEEMKRSKAVRDKALDYVPRTELGQGLSDSGKDLIGKGATAFMGFVKDPENAWMFGYMPEGIEAVKNLWNKLPEEARMSVEAGANIGEVLIGGGVLSGTKSAAKLGIPDIDTTPPTTKNIGKDMLTIGRDVPKQKLLPQLDQTANIDEVGFTSGIEEGIISLINSKKLGKQVPASQLLAMLKKADGVKKDELEWSTFSDYLEGLGKEKITPAKALQEARDRAITLEVVEGKAGGGRDSESPTFWDSMPEANIEGGTNYREMKFIFNTDTTGTMPKAVEAYKNVVKTASKANDLERIDFDYFDGRDTQIREADYWKLTGQDIKATSDQKEGLIRNLENTEGPYTAKLRDAEKNRVTAREEYNKLRDEIPREYESEHFPESNIIFHTRIRDRTVGGTNSLSLEEIQSDWHQGVSRNSLGYDLGPEEAYKKANADELRLIAEVKALDAEALEVEKAYDAAIIVENTYWARQVKPPEEMKKKNRGMFQLMEDLANKSVALEVKMDKAIKVQAMVDAGNYKYFTEEFTPNAPLKNESKWLGAALNAMSYKAVKEGYESIAWPKGHMQVKLYPDVSAAAHTALLKTYDTTIPKLISKALKKMDKSAAIEAGADMDFYHIKLTPKMKESILKGQPLFLAEGGLVAGYKHGGLVHDEMEALNLGTPTDYTLDGGLPKVNTPVEGDDREALNAAIIEMRRKEVETADTAIPTTFYDKDDQDFTAIYGTPKMPMADTEEPALEPLEATPTTAITETKEILTGASAKRGMDRGLMAAQGNSLEDGIKSLVYEVIQNEENDRGEIEDSDNWNKTTKRWLPHKSAEGGTQTIAYGHKFATQAEADAVTASGGITEEKAVEWFKEDMATAEGRAKKEYEVKYPDHKWSSLDTLGKLMLTEVVYNIGTLKDKEGEYDWTKLSVAVQKKDFKVAKGQLSRTYPKDGVKVALVKRTNALKKVYAKAVALTDWTK